jgi:hypothetical protein
MIKCPGLALNHMSVQHTVCEAADGDLGDQRAVHCLVELISRPKYPGSLTRDSASVNSAHLSPHHSGKT